jgi:hypothetical protein
MTCLGRVLAFDSSAEDVYGDSQIISVSEKLKEDNEDDGNAPANPLRLQNMPLENRRISCVCRHPTRV